MCAERFLSLPTSLPGKEIEPHKQAPWFILLKDAPRVDSRSWKQTSAEKGEIFQYDHEATHEIDKTYERTKKHSKSKMIIMGAIDSKRVKVQWVSAWFAPLTDEQKELLIAIDSLKSRIATFNDSGDYLSFGCDLKKGDMVQVSSSVLSKSQKDDVHGKLRYKGPLIEARGFDPKGTHFGVELSAKCGSSSGVHKGTAYFKCRDDHAVFVPINKLVPVSRQRQPKHAKEEKCTRSNHHQEDMPKPSFFKEGDEVEVQASLTKPHKKQWIKGKVVTSKRHDGKMLIGVEVEEDYPFAINAHGFYKGKSVFSPKNPARTVLAEISDVRSFQSREQENKAEVPPTDSSFPENAHLKQRDTDKELKAASPAIKKDHSSKDAGSKNIKNRSGVYPDHSAKFVVGKDGPEVSVSYSNPQCEQDQPATVAASMQEQMDFDEDHYRDTSSSKHTSSKELQEQRADGRSDKPKDGHNKGFFSTALDYIKGHEEPPFPLKKWHLEEISIHGKELLEILALSLNIKEAGEILKSKTNNFDMTSKLLKAWWDSLKEGHTASTQKLKDVLSQNGCKELVQFIEGALPTYGCFHQSIVDTVVFHLGLRLPQLADKLGVEITAHHLPPSILGEEIFRTWQKFHPGTEKLSILINTIWEISSDMADSSERDMSFAKRQSEELKDLALDLEQGLSEKVIGTVSSLVPNAEWKQLGFSLGLSELRLQMFDNKFPSLKDRVFNILRYWQMIQSYEVDQAEQLVLAFQSFNLEDGVLVIAKGLDEGCILQIAKCIGNQWKTLAACVCDPKVIHVMMKSSERDEDKALKVMRKWKRKQPASCEDLKEDLYNVLKHCKLSKAAKMVFDGLDACTLYNLARKVMFDLQPLRRALGIRSYDMKEFEKMGDPVQSSLGVLRLWNKTNVQDATRLLKLCHALKEVGLEDVADWLRNSEDDDEDSGGDVGHLNQNSVAVASKNPDPEVKAVDRILLEKVADQLKKHRADISLLNEFLKITPEDSKFAPKALQTVADPYLYKLLTWRQKMKHLKLGKQEIGLILRESLKGCGLDEAANFISDGTPVDGKASFGGPVVHDSEQGKDNFNVNSMVEFDWGGNMYQGTILWIGHIVDFNDHGDIAGIETEEPLDFGGNSHLFRNLTDLQCEYGRGIFIPLKRCRPDSRFPSEFQMLNEVTKTTKEDFGNIECDPIEGYIPPQKTIDQDRVGMYKGIQGDHNSCYMDVTLYSMFAFSDIFDEILGWPSLSEDEVQLIKDVLREQIVNPLRWKGVVRADYILHFREMLNELSSMKGLRTEEKDPEEFIHTLLQELLSAKPFLKISQGESTTMESFIYQIFLGKQDFLEVPSVEQLVHLSFLESDLKLEEVPECFIVQLPRFGKQFKLYDWIIPSLEMNITPIVKNSTRPCTVCGRLAFSECKDCRPKIKADGEIIQSYCADCWKVKHKKFPHHKSMSVACGPKFMDEYNYRTKSGQDPTAAESIYDNYKMELFSVMCIETSHYVAFVKTGDGRNSQWVFFDSMADRIGDHKGYNVPKVTHLCNFEDIVQSENLIEQLKMPDFHPHIKRLLGDAYICFYRLVKKPDPTIHGSDSSHDFQQNVDQASHSNFQKPPRREDSFHSSVTSSDFSPSMSSQHLLNRNVLRPQDVMDIGEDTHQHGETSTRAVSSSIAPMDIDNLGQVRAHGRLSPNIAARSRRHESRDSPSGVGINATGCNNQNNQGDVYNSSFMLTLQINQQSSAGEQHQCDRATATTNTPVNNRGLPLHSSESEEFV